jgi:bifunctional non-homologous end joining protein LigD
VKHEVEITRPDKVLFPRDGITKGDLVSYYVRVAPLMLPHLRDRPISMKRYPDGIDRFSFLQKDVHDSFPAWVRTEVVDKAGGTLRQVIVDDVDTLVYIANQACIELHVWLSRIAKRHYPDRMVIDFDPPQVGNPDVRRAAREAAAMLADLGLVPFVMASGSRGYHLHVPLVPRQDFDEVRAFARAFSRWIQSRDPERLTVEHRKNKRGGRIFIDVLRNGYAQTAVAPYSVRARDGAPVATPLGLSELSRSDMHPQRYTIRNLFRRVARRGDPWLAMAVSARTLTKPTRELRRRMERDGVRAGLIEAA